MLSQFATTAFLAAAGSRIRHDVDVEPDGVCGQGGRHRHVPDVGVVDRSDDRPWIGVLRRQEAVASAFAPAVAGALRNGKLDEAIKLSDRLQEEPPSQGGLRPGLAEFKSHDAGSDVPGRTVDASKRALERAQAITHAELNRGLSGLATIGSTAPFVGLFGTVVGIINAFEGISQERSTGLGAVAGGISEALVATAIGLFCRASGGLDVQLLQLQGGRL